MKDYKIIFADLDNILIETNSGKDTPEGIWDMKFKLDVFKAIKKVNPLIILIATNQERISKGELKVLEFKTKLDYICASLSSFTGAYVQATFSASSDDKDWYRKPNIGMLEDLFNSSNFTKSDCIMIGNSNIDKKTAFNFDINYIDINNFLKEIK